MSKQNVNRIAKLIDEEDAAQAAASTSGESSKESAAVPKEKDSVRRRPGFGADARSRRDALKERIRPRLFDPGDKMRGYCQRFRRLRRELNKLLEPTGAAQRAAIEGLAHLYVNLQRTCEMSKLLRRLQPKPIDGQIWENIDRARRDVAFLERLFKAHRKQPVFDFSSPQADDLATSIVDHTIHLKEETTPGEEQMTEEDMDDYDRKEWQVIKRDWNVVRKFQRNFTDRVHVIRVLTGALRPSAAEAQALWKTLQRILELERGYLLGQKDFIERYRTQSGQVIAHFPGASDRLERLLTEQLAIEREIDRKLRVLL